VSHEGTKFSNAVHVDPGYTRVVSVLLNDWFAFNKTGEYQIEITLLPPNKAIGEEASDRIGERLVLTILPRGEATLASGCSALLTQAKDSQSYATALVAAKALSVVDDPVAVQFMAEAVKRREFASLMIAALARLNTDEAVNALRSASRSSDNETSSLARAALSALGKSERQVRIDVP